ncbi:MAG TPA: thioredoxin family protein [Nitrososphaerales archaeon]|nr:thioredoxin family protein [Nitrososphaerales archaeon]
MMAKTPALGKEGPNFENLPGTDGKSYSLSSFGDKQILVLVFMGNGCPTCKATEERLFSIQSDYGKAGVQVVAVNSNNAAISPQDTVEEMRTRARERKYPFPYLKDDGAMLARLIGARTTPHAFILDRSRRLRYRGRVDNARQKHLITVHDVRLALDDLIAGTDVEVPDTDSFGCGIVW